ncbi:O-antigen ligase family protein [Phenylobacterium sp.]|uniref:O-antigen ligase family protein n=1 Tax=Phenylobacterium sp. TaxID=1871053 RepID=UPI00301C126A
MAKRVRRWFSRGEADTAALPVLAGFRSSPPPALRILLLTALAAGCIAYGFAFGALAPSRMMPFTLPIILLAGLILWALPPGEYAPTRLLEPLFIAFFAALILWPNYLAVSVLNLPWMTMLRVTGAPLMLVFLACISISKTFRSEMKEILNADRIQVRLIIALLALWTLTIPLSSDIGSSVNRYAVALVNLIGIFFLSCYLFSRPTFALLWTRILLLSLGVVCMFAIWESRIHQLPWAQHIPPFLKIDDPVVQKILSAGFGRTGIYRTAATQTTPLGLAELLGLSLPFAMHLSFSRYGLITRGLAALLVPLSVWVILLTDSRLGFVAACASVLFYVLFWAILRWRQVKSSIFAPAIVLGYPAVFVAFLTATFVVRRLRNEFWGTGEQQFSTQSRLDQWADATPMILKNPIGHGIGQGASTLGWTNLAGVLTIDSYWLSVLLEIGVLGFIVFYGLMLRGSYKAMRGAMEVRNDPELSLLIPMSVMLLNFVIVKMVFSQEANHALAFMVLGAIVALTYRLNTKTGVTGSHAR